MQDHRMVIRADARAMGAITALNTTNRRKPRTYVSASECISYYNADKSDAVIFRAARSATTRKPNRRSTVTPNDLIDMQNKRDSVAHRTAADLAPIGNVL